MTRTASTTTAQNLAALDYAFADVGVAADVFREHVALEVRRVTPDRLVSAARWVAATTVDNTTLDWRLRMFKSLIRDAAAAIAAQMMRDAIEWVEGGPQVRPSALRVYDPR